MGGHATHDEAEARAMFSAEVFAEWGRRDPVGCYEEWLAQVAVDLRDGVRVEAGAAERSNREVLSEVEDRVAEEVEQAAEEALTSRDRMPSPESIDSDVYATRPNSEYPGPAPW